MSAISLNAKSRVDDGMVDGGTEQASVQLASQFHLSILHRIEGEPNGEGVITSLCAAATHYHFPFKRSR